MADFYDWFNGAAGNLLAHTSDSGHSWLPSGVTALLINGTGSAYNISPPSTTDQWVYTSWTPPSADYETAMVFGAAYPAEISTLSACGPTARHSGPINAQKFYYLQIQRAATDNIAFYNATESAGTPTYTPIGVITNLATQVIAGDIFTLRVQGTSPVTLTALRNGTVLYSATDGGGAPITSAGSCGMRVIAGTVTLGNDQIRGLWAGAVGTMPTLTIAPPTPTVVPSGTQSFTLSTALTGETFAWSASAGSVSGALATEVWTAPGSGTSATVTGASIDLPGRTATASVTISSGAAATVFTLTGPSSGYKLNASSNFTFTPSGGPYTGTITPTMTGGLAGTWAPTSLSWSASSTAKTATFTPSATGSGTANGTASPALTQPAGIAYTSNPQTLAVTPGALPTSSTTAETFTGGGTFWLTSTPTFGPASAPAGVSIGAVTVDSNTQARANITTGAATGTITWTDSTTGATVTELVAAIANVLSIGEGFATGLSTDGYAVYDTAGVSVTAWTSVGVTERGASSGDYGAVVPIPQDGADYEIRWSQGSGTTPPFVHDVRRVAAPASGSTGTAPTVAQIATAVWQDVAAGDFGVTGSIGNIVKTNLDVVVSTRSTYAGGPVASVTAPVTAGTVTDKTGYSLNLAQIGLAPRSLNTVADAALTVGDALMAAICEAAGKETTVGTTYTKKTPSTGTVIRSFTLDSPTAPTSRQ
jgi:hypothetical protein